MAKILVTGGAGYIGSHACKALAQTGHEPVVFDNLDAGHREAVRWGPLEQGELTDLSRLQEVIRRHDPEAVIHFAAHAYVGESVVEPEKYYRNNIVGSLTLLEALRATSVRRVVFSSSCAVYGPLDQVPVEETHPCRPINPYGFTKLAVERMLADFGAAYGFRSACLRYFNAAGADPEGELGELHAPETHLIPLALAAAAGKGPPLPLMGDDYPTLDGSCIRDYIHVTDLAAAHLLALGVLDAEAPAQQVFNLSTGRGFSVLEVLDMIAHVTGRPVPVHKAPRRHGDPPCLVGEAGLAKKCLGWEPRHSDLETIIETAWRWFIRQA